MKDFVDSGVSYIIRPDGTKERINVSLVKEHTLSIYINGEKKYSIVCSNDKLEELVIGRLLTEGLIHYQKDISEIKLGPSGEEAFVTLSVKPLTIEQSAESEPLKGRPGRVEMTDWTYDTIFELAKFFSKGMPVHSVTRGTHSCMLARGSEVIFSCEDIGRHNTVDKAAGYALKNDINLSECILFISGRVPTDMMMKVIRTGIPVLVSKSVPTSEAVCLADKYGVTLIVKAYPDQLEICHRNN